MTQPPRIALAAFRRLTLLYPAQFRLRYGAEMEEFFVREWARTSGRGLFWLRTVGDACRAALRLRLTGSPPGQPPREKTGMFSALLQDVRHGLRAVRRAPAFHFGAVAILAIGIGATAAAFSIVDGVLIRPLPYPGAERLLQIGSTFRMNPERLGPLSEPDAIAIQRNTTTLEAFAAVGGGSRILLGTGDPEELSVASVTEGYLDMLGARPALGRLLLPDDHAPGAPRVVVLEHGFWVDRFGGDIDLVGQTLELDNDVYEIIGVLHADFLPPGRLPGAGYPIWTQMGLSSREPVEGRFFLSALGRMRPGMSPTDVEAEITRVIEERYADGTGANFVVGGTAAPLRERLLQGSGRPIMLAQAGVALLLLITCVNVASLLLARASDRRNELAVRSALGAHPRRVMAQLLVESVTLSAIAGVVGAGVAFLGVEAFKAVSPGTLPRLQEVSVDGRILGFTLVISAVTGIAFGLLPALQASRVDVSDVLREGGRGGTGSRTRSRIRSALIVGEVALAVILALASGLMANSYVRLTRVDPGFQANGLLTMRLDLRLGYGDRESWTPRFAELLDRARALPGVESATLTSQVPFTGDGIVSRYTPEDLPPEFGDEGVWLDAILVGDEFLPTMQASLIEGRTLDASDGAGSTPVMLVNEALVRAYWPGVNSAVGRSIKSGGPGVDEPTFQIVGVIGDIKQQLGRDPSPQVFVHYEQEPWRSMTVLLRTAGQPEALVPALRAIVREMDPNLPIARVATVTNLAADSLIEQRFYAVIVSSFGFLALLLALVGVYGTTSYTTRQRTREIGIRLALGANRHTVVGAIVRRALATATVGVVLGIVGGVATTHMLATFLFGVAPLDPATFGAVAVIVAVAAATAAYLPARRAARVDPSFTLREE